MAQLHIRNIEEETVLTLKARARARGWTVAELIKNLLILHAAAQARYERGEGNMEALLDTLGLQPVKV